MRQQASPAAAALQGRCCIPRSKPCRAARGRTRSIDPAQDDEQRTCSTLLDFTPNAAQCLQCSVPRRSNDALPYMPGCMWRPGLPGGGSEARSDAAMENVRLGLSEEPERNVNREWDSGGWAGWRFFGCKISCEEQSGREAGGSLEVVVKLRQERFKWLHDAAAAHGVAPKTVDPTKEHATPYMLRGALSNDDLT